MAYNLLDKCEMKQRAFAYDLIDYVHLLRNDN